MTREITLDEVDAAFLADHVICAGIWHFGSTRRIRNLVDEHGYDLDQTQVRMETAYECGFALVGAWDRETDERVTVLVATPLEFSELGGRHGLAAEKAAREAANA